MKQNHRYTNRRRALLPVLFLLFAIWSLSAALSNVPCAVSTDAGLEGSSEKPAPFPAQANQKLIALTFDDGPLRSTTTNLLDGLAERGAHATFFLIGCQVEQNQDLVQRMDREGHQIGIHTYDHVLLTSLSRSDFDLQVNKTRGLLQGILKHNDFLLRPPYGILDENVQNWADCPLILWSIDPEDWRDQNAEREVEQIVREAQDGSIILMHDIYPESVAAALQVIDRLHARGYLFCTVEELFAARGIPLESGEKYCSAYP